MPNTLHFSSCTFLISMTNLKVKWIILEMEKKPWFLLLIMLEEEVSGVSFYYSLKDMKDVDFGHAGGSFHSALTLKLSVNPSSSLLTLKHNCAWNEHLFWMSSIIKWSSICSLYATNVISKCLLWRRHCYAVSHCFLLKTSLNIEKFPSPWSKSSS